MSVQIDPRIDHYKVLGVKPDASGADIKKAYRRLAKKYHPDSTGGDKAKESKFKEVSHAYDVLSDDQKRTQYDALRSGAGQVHNFQGFPGGGPGEINLNDIFAQMFQGGARRGNVNVRFDGAGGSPFGRRPSRRSATHAPAEHKPTPPTETKIRLSDGSSALRRGADVHSDLRLTLDQAILGTVADVATMDGKGRLKVPPGTSSGVKLRLKGKGARTKDGAHGHHYVTVHIDVPTKLDEEAKQLLIQFMQRTKR